MKLLTLILILKVGQLLQKELILQFQIYLKVNQATLDFINKEGDIKKIKIENNGTHTVLLPKDNTCWKLLVDKDLQGHKVNVTPDSFVTNKSCLNGRLNVS